jgi:hypothetical protein
MMDNSPPGGDDDYDGGVLSDNIRKAVLAITRDKETSNKLIALCDYALNDDQKLIVYSPLPSIDPLYQDTASFVEGIKTTIYFRNAHIHPTLLLPREIINFRGVIDMLDVDYKSKDDIISSIARRITSPASPILS